MLGLSNLQVEVVSPAEVNLVNPGGVGAECPGVLSLVVAQVVVLLYEVPEGDAVIIAGKLDFAVVTGNVHQVVGAVVTVDVRAVVEAVAAWAIALIEH